MTDLSEKDKGNENFKRQQYSQAVKHYQQYVRDEHIDNKNAYFNLSLCYSKLKRPHQSIQAAEKALEIDKSYAKCYYRLALQYQKVAGKEYEIFINAAHFQRVAGSEQHSEKQEMKKVCHNYKYFYCKNQGKEKHSKNEDSIIQECAVQLPKPESDVSVDKTFDEWLIEWNQDIQSEEAKWVELEYIMEEINYDLGQNLAYFYINQLKDPEKKESTRKKLKELKERLGKSKQIMVQQLDINLQEDVKASDGEQNQVDENQNLQESQTISGANHDERQTIQKQEVNISKAKQEGKSPKNVPRNPKKLLEEKKLQKMKKKVEEMNPNQKNYQPQTFKEIKQLISKEKQKQNTNLPSQPSKAVIALQTSKKQSEKTIKIDNKIEVGDKIENSLESIYEKMTKELTESKDIFTAVYRCVIGILQDKQLDSSQKGWLIVQLRKRVKKFKRIMQATSENEQKIVFDLLKRTNLQEYAIDLAPIFHKI